MALNRMLQKLHSLLNGRLLRRATAMALAASMVLPMTSAFGFTAQNKPTVLVTEGDVKVEAPTINIELNAVVDAAGELTGELEIALWAKSGVVDGTLQPFNTLAVALQFSQALVPYDFSGKEVNLDNTEGFTVMTGMETLKKCNLLSTAGAMVSGIPAGEGGGGYLVLTASAHRPIELKEMTLLSVVTFKYDLASATTKPKATEVSAVNAWLAEQGKYLNENLNAPIKFAPAAVIDNADGAAVERELTYSSSTNLMYWSDSSYKQDEQEDSKYVPKLAIEAVDTKGTTDTSDDTLSKLSNLMEVSTRYLDDSNKPRIVDHAINFTLVNKLTYDDAKLKNLVVIEMFDWADEQIGALIVPYNQDARQAVNDYVRDNLIHEDLRLGTTLAATEAGVSDLSRSATYRGKYPSTVQNAGVLDTAGNAVTGPKFPLTNKLDYVFFKRPMEATSKASQTAPQRSDYGTNADYLAALEIWNNTPDWKQKTGDDAWDTKYPYIYGWAVTDLDTVFDSNTTTWTTLGTKGELEGYNAADGTLCVVDGDFRFADFNFAENPQTPGTVYAVKAVYEAGESNQPGYYYTISTEPKIRRLTYTASTSGGGATYSMEFQFERYVVAGGKLYGTTRPRDPALQLQYTVDTAGLETSKTLDPFYLEVEITNTDVIDVKLTPAAVIVSMDYAIFDRYGLNFMIGGQRSATGADRDVVIANSEDYEHFSYANRFGSHGFIYTATINTLLEEGIKAAKDLTNTLSTHWRLESIRDINIRRNDSGAQFDVDDVVTGRQTFINMIKAAMVAGWSDEQIMGLEWHQIQYYFIHGDDASHTFLKPTADLVALEPYAAWCHQNDGCVSPDITVISDLETLLEAAQKAVDGNTASMATLLDMNLIINELYLRKDGGSEPVPYTNADLDAFKTAIIDVVRSAGTDDLSWGQVQYALLHGNAQGDPTDVETAMDTEYWWYQGGKKIADWDDVIVAVKTWAGGGYRAVLYTLKDNMSALMNLAKSATAKGDDDYSAIDPYTADDFDALCTKLRQAVTALSAISVQNPSWDQVQFYILRAPLLTGAEMNTFGLKHFWWYDGGTLVTDIPSLRNGIVAARTGRVAAIEQLTADEINNAPLYIRNFDGTAFDAATFKTMMENIPATINVSGWDWLAVQYYALHNAYDYESALGESSYYWWEGGNTTPTTVTTARNVSTLLDAAFRALYNGNTTAWNNLTAAQINNTYLRNPAPGSGYEDVPKFASLPEFVAGDVAGFKTKIETLIRDNIDTAHPHYPPFFTWYQVQKYIIEGDSTAASTDARNFWWSTGSDNTNVPQIPEGYTKLLAAMKSGSVSDSNASADWLNDAKLSRSATSLTTWTARQARNATTGAWIRINAMLDERPSGTSVEDFVDNLTWAQVQYAIVQSSAPYYTTTPPSYSWDPTATSSNTNSTNSVSTASLMNTMSFQPTAALNRSNLVLTSMDLTQQIEEPEEPEESVETPDLATQLNALAADPDALAALSDEEKSELLTAAQALLVALTEPVAVEEQTEEKEQVKQVEETRETEESEQTEDERQEEDQSASTYQIEDDTVVVDTSAVTPAPGAVEETEGSVQEKEETANLSSDPRTEADPEEEQPDPVDTSQTTTTDSVTPQIEEGEIAMTTNTDNLSTTAANVIMTKRIVRQTITHFDSGGRSPTILSRSLGKVVMAA